MLLTQRLTTPLIIIIPEYPMAILTAKTMAMKLSRLFPRRRGRLEVLAFNTAVAGCAERVVEFVVMPRAVGVVVRDVEFRGGEG